MTFGMQITTDEGIIYDTSDAINIGRIYARISGSSTTGDFTVPGFDASIGSIWLTSVDGKFLPQYEFDNSTKEFSWEPRTGISSANSSSNFLVQFLVYK